MKDKIETFIFSSLSKLDTASIIILIPALALLYIVLFVDVDKLTDAFSEDTVIIEYNETSITCPCCNEVFILKEEHIIDIDN